VRALMACSKCQKEIEQTGENYPYNFPGVYFGNKDNRTFIVCGECIEGMSSRWTPAERYYRCVACKNKTTDPVNLVIQNESKKTLDSLTHCKDCFQDMVRGYNKCSR